MLDVASLVNLYRFGERESPWTQLDERRVATAGDIIRERVKGQDEAVDRVVTMIVRAFLGLAGVQHSKHDEVRHPVFRRSDGCRKDRVGEIPC